MHWALRAARSLHGTPLRISSPSLRVTRSLSLSTRGFATVVNKDPVEFDTITRLPNGLRVATEALPGSFSGVGVYIDAGSRFENSYLRGVSHIMDRLAFKSTAHRSADAMLETVETLGGNIQCASSREAMMYQAATFNDSVPTALGLLAETIREPSVTEEELLQQLETAHYEIKEIWSKPELVLPELVHMAAFRDNTLGNPLLCPEERLPFIDRQVIEMYRSAFYRPERMVVSFVGVPHEEAVGLVTKYFGDMKSAAAQGISPDTSKASEASSAFAGAISPTPMTYIAPKQQPSTLGSRIPFIKHLSTTASQSASLSDPSLATAFSDPLSDPTTFAPARYTGGFLSLPPQPLPPNPQLTPTFTHLHVAFEGLAITDPDIYALATLQTLLGGGGSFSAGGPGKGMYSRLYTEVLNQHGWVESAVAFNHAYSDSGIFGIAAACMPGRARAMLQVLVAQLLALTQDGASRGSVTVGAARSVGTAGGGVGAIARPLGDAEVGRAKNQLRSSLLMNLESRMVGLEDLGRQVQVHGRRVPVREMLAKIESLTVDDLRRVARRVLLGGGGSGGAPTVVMQEALREGSLLSSSAGAVEGLDWEEIQDRIERGGLGRRW